MTIRSTQECLLDLHFHKRKQLSFYYSNIVSSITVIFGQCLFRKYVYLHLQTQYNIWKKMYVANKIGRMRGSGGDATTANKRGAGSYYTQSNCLWRATYSKWSGNPEGMSCILHLIELVVNYIWVSSGVSLCFWKLLGVWVLCSRFL